MTAGALDPGVDPDRWLSADRGALWEVARVVGVERGASATSLRLRLAEPTPALPGQYYLVRLAVDVPPGVIEQAYSLCSSPYPPTANIEIVVREVPGGRASPLLARRVQVGDVLQVQGPFGFLTWTKGDGGPLGLIGAGSGVAPLASIVRYATACHLEVPMTLLCSSRDRARALLGSELLALSQHLSWLTLVQTFTRSPRDPSVLYHRRIDADLLAEVMGMGHDEQLAPRAFYVAGPADMVRSVRAALSDLGVPDPAINSEYHV